MGVQQSKGSLEVWRAGPEGEHILTALAPGRGRGFKKEYITPAQLQPFVLKLLKMTTYTFVDGTLEVLEVQDTPEAWRVYVKAEGLQAPDVSDTEDEEELKGTHLVLTNMPDVPGTEEKKEGLANRPGDYEKAEKFADYFNWGCFAVVTAVMLLLR